MLRITVAVLALSSAYALADPAPEGESRAVSQKLIHENAEIEDCPTVVQAKRNIEDGTIEARCSNGAAYKVLTVPSVGPTAIPCATAFLVGSPCAPAPRMPTVIRGGRVGN